MKLSTNLKNIMYYIMITAFYIMIGVVSIALLLVGMIYIMDSINVIDTVLGVWVLISPIILMLGTNKYILKFGKSVGIKNKKHIIIWNSLTVITMILMYNII